MTKTILTVAFLILFVGPSLAHPIVGIRGNVSSADFTLHVSNGIQFRVHYNNSISVENVSKANAILAEQLPKLFTLFWMPSDDVNITVNQVACKVSTACTAGNVVNLNASDWGKSGTWVHEFTHVLQNVVGERLSGDAQLFYTEPTAEATAAILTNESAFIFLSNNHLWITDWGVEAATYAYYYRNVMNDTHIPTNIWLDLYGVDHAVFTEVNMKLLQYARYGIISDIPSLRELISESTSVQNVEGSPIKRWLAIDGLLRNNEVGKTTLPAIGVGLSAHA